LIDLTRQIMLWMTTRCAADGEQSVHQHPSRESTANFSLVDDELASYVSS